MSVAKASNESLVGTVVFYNTRKGFGFVKSKAGHKYFWLFVHKCG